MKHLLKHFTVGAVLGLAVMFSGIGEANATLLLGETVGVDFLAPDLATLQGTDSATVIDPGVEFVNFLGLDRLDIDFSDNLIKITARDTFSFADLAFNGLRIFDFNNTIFPWGVSVNEGMTTPSLLGLFSLTGSNKNEIFLNVSDLDVVRNNMIALDVKPVPEPSTMLLLGTGLVGLVGYRMKKAKA